jgi:hypothetical protein
MASLRTDLSESFRRSRKPRMANLMSGRTSLSHQHQPLYDSGLHRHVTYISPEPLIKEEESNPYVPLLCSGAQLGVILPSSSRFNQLLISTRTHAHTHLHYYLPRHVEAGDGLFQCLQSPRLPAALFHTYPLITSLRHRKL